MLRNGLEPWHLLIVAIVAIMLFGPKRLPDSARALGRSLRILKSEARAMKTDEADARHAPAARPIEPTSVVPAPETVCSTTDQRIN
ncbi:Sec-independent protein translocase subunit TatA [Yinghuangia seranimata]|uniref:Sec-independent protein translocase subunit TatA n=1 Tax=Yinghuangia seranimata TaxID=408067 RepID=UPI00248C57EE|nr:Sec-independent protein translocase subunit TatA [Yinghuangia seranimata]MDI2128374.1 Sec-independent protein translocase subunit TatA [Yinghuangia seranimata]